METTYLKLFKNHSEYNVEDTPNVSYCEAENKVHYNPVETRLVAKFNVESTSNATQIIDNDSTSYFTEIEIDGVVQPSVVSSYTFDTTGEHVVKYTLVDPTTIGEYVFYSCSGLISITIPDNVTTIGTSAFKFCGNLTNIIIPDSVTTIGNNAFYNCYSLTSITIPDSVTSIGSTAFGGCSGLTSVTVEATTPPTLGSHNVFNNNASGRKIYVPSESVSTYKAASGWSIYANDIEAIS